MQKVTAPKKKKLTNLYVTNITQANHKFLKKDSRENGMYVGQYINHLLDQLRGKNVSKRAKRTGSSKSLK